MSITENLNKIKSEIPGYVDLIAVSKTKPAGDIQEAYSAGHRMFGENKARETENKYEELPKDIRWHFIGHLQRNKVKYIAPFVQLIHSLDSPRLAKEINKRAKSEGRTIPCLLQLHISGEETKFGFDRAEALDFLASERFTNMKNIEIAGAMGMALHTDETAVLRKQFAELRKFYEELKSEFSTAKHLSMGMTNDYQTAIDEGSNMIRLGSSIFGARHYE